MLALLAKVDENFKEFLLERCHAAGFDDYPHLAIASKAKRDKSLLVASATCWRIHKGTRTRIEKRNAFARMLGFTGWATLESAYNAWIAQRVGETEIDNAAIDAAAKRMGMTRDEAKDFLITLLSRAKK